MKLSSLAMFAVLVALCGCSTPHATSSDAETSVSGGWTGEWRTAAGDHVERFSVDLNQDGEALSGTGVDEHGEPAKAKGSVVGDKVQVTLWNQDGSAIFTGVLAAGAIRGSWTMGDESGPFWIKRQPPQKKNLKATP